jgi:hypothetical protein
MLEYCNSLLKQALNKKYTDKTSRIFLFLLIQVAQEWLNKIMKKQEHIINMYAINYNIIC